MGSRDPVGPVGIVDIKPVAGRILAHDETHLGRLRQDGVDRGNKGCAAVRRRILPRIRAGRVADRVASPFTLVHPQDGRAVVGLEHRDIDLLAVRTGR